LVQGEAVYHDAREGFQFAPPAAWSQHARAQYPPGRQEKERILVKYKRLDEEGPAFWRASMIDLAETVSPSTYLRDRPPGPEDWRPASGTETVTVDGVPGEKVTFTGIWEEGEKQVVVKEVVAVRRNDRVYFFTGIYPASDKTARSLIRQAVASVAWDKGPGTRE
jgi:hypothetical protein